MTAEVGSGLVKLVVMTSVFFNNQQHKIKIKRFICVKQIKSSFLGDSWNQHFYSYTLFNTASVLLNFSWLELQMLLRCCLIHISIMILRHVLYLLCLCPCLDLGLFMSYLCDLFFIFIFIFIMINSVISSAKTRLRFCLFFRLCPIIFG